MHSISYIYSVPRTTVCNIAVNILGLRKGDRAAVTETFIEKVNFELAPE